MQELERHTGTLTCAVVSLHRPGNHYARVALVTGQLRTRHEFRPPLRKVPGLVRAFAGIARDMTRDRESAFNASHIAAPA